MYIHLKLYKTRVGYSEAWLETSEKQNAFLLAFWFDVIKQRVLAHIIVDIWNLTPYGVTGLHDKCLNSLEFSSRVYPYRIHVLVVYTYTSPCVLPWHQFNNMFLCYVYKLFLRDMYKPRVGRVTMTVYRIIRCYYSFLVGLKCIFRLYSSGSLYYNMDIGTMWHCALVSRTPSQSIGLFFRCALFWCWVPLCVPFTNSLIVCHFIMMFAT